MKTNNETDEVKDTLKSFLKEEAESVRKRLDALKGKVKAEEYDALNRELNEKSALLDSIEDEDDSQIFVLRREIGMLKENADALVEKKGWWSRLPVSVRVGIFILPVLLYFVWFTIVQLSNQDKIYDYPATQTVVAEQAARSSFTETPTPTPSEIP
jgi:hypothetical protein